MPRTIEVEIDASGQLRALEPLPVGRRVRALLVLPDEPSVPATQPGSAARALSLLASPRFAKRPRSDPEEVRRRLAAMREDWDGSD